MRLPLDFLQFSALLPGERTTCDHRPGVLILCRSEDKEFGEEQVEESSLSL